MDATIMNNIEHQVREKSLCRLAEIFNVGISELSDEIDLTTTFKASTVKFWKRNHFDMILDDIRDVAGKEMIKLLNKGEVEIKTVKDYVEFMIICYRKNPQLVELVLGEMKK